MNNDHLEEPVEWKDIPGFNGAYQISWNGDVRSFRYRGRLCRKSHNMKPYRRGSAKRWCVALIGDDGKLYDVPVLKAVADAWLGGCPDGMVVRSKNGNDRDFSVSNVEFISVEDLGRNGGKKNRKSVAKIDRLGKVVERYSSVSAAAKANYISRACVSKRCNRKIDKPFALDGYNYIWGSEASV